MSKHYRMDGVESSSTLFQFLFFRTYREAVVPASKKNFTVAWVGFPQILASVFSFAFSHVIAILSLVRR